MEETANQQHNIATVDLDVDLPVLTREGGMLQAVNFVDAQDTNLPGTRGTAHAREESVGLPARTAGFIKSPFLCFPSSLSSALRRLSGPSECDLRGQLDDTRAASTQAGIGLRLIRSLSDQALLA
jgi:hypothetical protein